MHQERLGRMTADQKCLLLPQIYFVNQSLREAGGKQCQQPGHWQAEEPGPFDPGGARQSLQTNSWRWPNGRAASPPQLAAWQGGCLIKELPRLPGGQERRPGKAPQCEGMGTGGRGAPTPTRHPTSLGAGTAPAEAPLSLDKAFLCRGRGWGSSDNSSWKGMLSTSSACE